ncbi:MAG: hypothetical protein WC763_05300 [Candidatus Paceibacterota bacterium]|jgi:hypothetical protein
MKLESIARVLLVIWMILWTAALSILLFCLIAFIAVCAIFFIILILSNA